MSFSVFPLPLWMSCIRASFHDSGMSYVSRMLLKQMSSTSLALVRRAFRNSFGISLTPDAFWFFMAPMRLFNSPFEIFLFRVPASCCSVDRPSVVLFVSWCTGMWSSAYTDLKC